MLLGLVSIGCLFVGSQIAYEHGQSVAWYTGFGQWLGALGSFAAAGVALWISTSDRRDRESERLAEEQTHARLVRMSLDWHDTRAAVTAKLHNYGALPVLDVELVDAAWSEHPEAPWTALDNSWRGRRDYKPILKSHRGGDDTVDTVFELSIRFGDPEESPLAEVVPRTAGYVHPSYKSIDLAKVVVRIRFTTANGIRWEMACSELGAGEPIRIHD
ncbi:hypothetical protein C1S79_25770 [Mycolicibacterium phocaicum]|uniref:Uncharacterized protein n=1 Tax=Mycolicibacterium phocaicum TaxID=319706 RepID=A0AA94R5K2_9MYCO|nr:hypothetical protein C1S79_25770 [Mycolicibacterium phocaicum]